MENKILDWGLKDSLILDEMKQKCFKFNGWQYKSRNSKERFRVLCLLEDYANAYYDLKEETERQSKAQVILDNQIAEMLKYKERNEKAIEYIGNGNIGIPRKTRDKFIAILKGEDNTPQESLYKYTPEKGFRLGCDEDVKD